jgi:hypothetical protein
MNEQQRAVVQQALEALKGLRELHRGQGGLTLSEINRIHKNHHKSIDELTQLLEQPADWIDLSVEQKMRIHYECEDSISYAIELTLAKLREKNGGAA